jgi:broad-specificity NMP kinase
MRMNSVILLVGVPASGKSWVTSQLTGRYTVVEQDDFIDRQDHYAPAIAEAATESSRAVIANAPFGTSELVESLKEWGCEVEMVFLLEDEVVLQARWDERGTPDRARKSHLSRQRTYAARATELGAFAGTSAEVLEHLAGKVPA